MIKIVIRGVKEAVEKIKKFEKDLLKMKLLIPKITNFELKKFFDKPSVFEEDPYQHFRNRFNKRN